MSTLTTIIIGMTPDFLNDLNENQQQAVVCTEKPSIILAGAGSGKTRVLTYKVRYLIEEKKVDPSAIMMVTFTNKAASEMKQRVKIPLGFIGTFHSFCAGVLRRYAPEIGMGRDFVIYDEDDKKMLIGSIIKTINTQRKITASYVIHVISSAKDNLLDPKQYRTFANNSFDEILADIYEKYQAKLLENNAVDFDDLLSKTVTLFRSKPHVLAHYHEQFEYVLIDEYQDTNYVQYLLSKQLAAKNKKITVVGDFSQSI